MNLLSIGALSRATKVPIDTLRTWERRYGFPVPFRLPSGHRRYAPATVERVALVRRALESGGRASEVVAASPEVLHALTREVERHGARDGLVETWIASVEALRADELEGHFRLAWDRHGARAFAEELAVDFLRTIGRRWAEGRFAIAHEHFATEQLRDFLARRWRRLGGAARGGVVACATLPGEMHTIGLHLGAVLLTLGDRKVTLLGGSMPPDEIVRAVEDSGAGAVLIGTSGVAPPAFRGDLRRLRSRLASNVAVLVGGPVDSPELLAHQGVVHVADLPSLSAWCSREHGVR